jgi:penicillin-binding protein 1A
MTVQPQEPIKKRTNRSRLPWPIRWILNIILTILGIGAAGVLTLAIAVIFIWPTLPELTNLKNYQPNLPLRIYTADGYLLSEFGSERRKMTKLKDIPDIMKNALLVIEDSSFYKHHGVDLYGVGRAVVKRFRENSKEGASTITMQVARGFYLTNEQKFSRKFYEVLLSYKIERELSKEEILEIYMNQVYLGQNAYGFAAAAQTYFGKPLSEITIAEAAMLAGLPKAPSSFNPCPNIERETENLKDLRARTKQRQQHILNRLLEFKHITPEQYKTAVDEQITCVTSNETSTIHADYVAEMARDIVFKKYGNEAYSLGLKVYTTINSKDQEAAYESLRKGLMDYSTRHGYKGPEETSDPEDPFKKGTESTSGLTKNEEKALRKYHPDSDELLSAVVLSVSPKKMVVAREQNKTIEINAAGLRFASGAINSKKIRRGSIVRIMKNKKEWVITQMPTAEAGFVAVDPKTGAIRALVGGFDFNKSKFNHVDQGRRQPGSSFKPFIYSAALSKGFNPNTIVNDSPLTVGNWSPKNSDGNYSGPIPLRIALMKSKNLVSVRVLQKITPEYVQEYIAKFGMDPKDHEPYLTMALGAGAVNMLRMAEGYSVFANGGYRVNPYLIQKITTQQGDILQEALPAKVGDEKYRAIPAWNAFLMDSMLRGVTTSGTAARASAALKRHDIAGKTGTTNQARDVWFAGYHNSVVGIAWVGRDDNKPLGGGETGGKAALPIWIGFMQHALKGVPVYTRPVPEGLVKVGSDYVSEDSQNAPVTSLDVGEGVDSSAIDTTASGEDTEVEQPDQPTRPEIKAPKEPAEEFKPKKVVEPAPVEQIDEDFKPRKRQAPAPIENRDDGQAALPSRPQRQKPAPIE